MLTGIQEGLEAEQFVSRQQLPPGDLKVVGSLGLFTAKPIIIAVNTDEDQLTAKSYPDREYHPAAVRAERVRDHRAVRPD